MVLFLFFITVAQFELSKLLELTLHNKLIINSGCALFQENEQFSS